MNDYQPRWLAYAAFMGLPPDSEELKGHRFICWIDEQAWKYREARGIKTGYPIVDQDDFTAFLNQVAASNRNGLPCASNL